MSSKVRTFHKCVALLFPCIQQYKTKRDCIKAECTWGRPVQSPDALIALAGQLILSNVCSFIARTPAFTVAISSICQQKHTHSLRSATTPASSAAGSSSGSSHYDASLHSLLHVTVQPIAAAAPWRQHGNETGHEASGRSVTSLSEPCSAAKHTSQLGRPLDAPDRASTCLAANQAAEVLACNVLMAPLTSINLPQSAKILLQEAEVFQACCTALLQTCRCQELPSWLRCAWGAANILQIAAGKPEQRTLVRLIAPSSL